MRFTEEQERAITMRPKKLLVSAAAGSGKTAVLVERVLRRLVDREDPLDVDEILVVTFTEAAADEMKSRIRQALEEHVSRYPGDERLRRQLLLLDRADICTLHSFCLKTIRQYFHKLGLDPAFVVLDEHEAELIKADVIEELLEDRYAAIPYRLPVGETGEAPLEHETRNGGSTEDFLKLVEWYGGKGGDESLSSLILRLHSFITSLPDPEDWLDKALQMFEAGRGEELRNTGWGKALIEQAIFQVKASTEWVSRAVSEAEKPDGPALYVDVLRDDLGNLKNLLETLETRSWDDVVAALNAFEFSSLPRRPRGDGAAADAAARVKRYRDRAKALIRSVKNSVLSRPSCDLKGELELVAPLMRVLAGLVVEFDRRYREAKSGRQGLDFSDLERYCLELLRSGPEGEAVRSRYREIFVDEYQDINPIQDAIIQLVSSGPPERKLFMVGDYRQSIYAFRLAEPGIFLSKYRSFPRALLPGRDELLTTLTANFRSRQEILDAVNFVFSRIMLEEVAGMGYGADEELRPGRTLQTPPVDQNHRGDPPVELHLVERDPVERSSLEGEAAENAGEEPDWTGGEISGDFDSGDLEALEKEALVVAAKIREVTSPAGLPIWDESLGDYRPCRFRDIVILMRATRNRCEAVLGILRRAGIPVYADVETGYFAAREVEIVLSLLSIIDNPLQDIPLASVLRSPIVGLDGEDLARIRLTAPAGRFFYAVQKAAFTPELGDLSCKLQAFLENLDRWRTMARRMPLGDLIWKLLSETGYLDYVGGMPGGAQRRANLLALCDRAREFDSFRRRGLFRFLRFIRRLEESQGDLGQARVLGEQENVVRVLSVHKAKGLEFPVVFVMDLGRRFDFKDTRQDVLYHRKLGLGPVIVDTEGGIKYPTLAHAALSGAIVRESMAEEMRILYVAMTRAKEKLFLVGSTRDLAGNLERWTEQGISASSVASAGTYLDWLAPCMLGCTDLNPRHVAEGKREFWAGVEPGASSDGNVLDSSKPPIWKVQFWGPGSYFLTDQPFVEGQGKTPPEITLETLKRLELPQSPPDTEILGEIVRRMEWRYPLVHLTEIPGKITVGELQARLDSEDEDAWMRSLATPFRLPAGLGDSDDESPAVIRGIAVHRLLAHIDLGLDQDESTLSAEIERLVENGVLTADEASLIDRVMVLDFLRSPVGRFLREHRDKVKREVPFTLRLPADLFSKSPANSVGGFDGSDYVVVQGTIDALVMGDEGIEIIDYKTDRVSREDTGALVERYTSQVSWYAFAAETILQRPVSRARVVFLQAREERDVPFREFLEEVFKSSRPEGARPEPGTAPDSGKPSDPLPATLEAAAVIPEPAAAGTKSADSVSEPAERDRSKRFSKQALPLERPGAST
ncbi:MAG TPA: helicase-exonuclease AddAB subunit AddA [Firmicutes bacterium]|nr:helicase-exonuclease AddAB subunit AddA [Candidatus Fermentithermobacillaceae bacterium]